MIPAAYPSLFLMKLEQPQYAPYLTTLVAPAPHYTCPICTEPLVIRHDGRRGPEWRCVAVPACPGFLRHCRSCNAGAMLPITLPEPGEQCSACGDTVLWCPQCESGTLVERTSKHGVFLACSEWRGGAGCRYTRSLTVQR
jgi:ssDNA-binding Zn-finger/Zn-ribbon topoisomerase 1